jgi:hypothetical protein
MAQAHVCSVEKRIRSTGRGAVALSLIAALSLAQPATAQAPEDILAGSFDAVTGVPFAKTMLEIVRSGAQSPQSPEVMDARLRAVEALLRDIDPRLRRVEALLRQLQNVVVKVSNINRLRELQRIRGDLAVINAELKTKPTDPSHRSILVFRAQQQADVIKNNVDFDIWKWSDVSAADQSVRTRFLVYPSFELYAIAIATWFNAIELESGDRPQRVVATFGAALREHAAFLETRIGFRDLLDDPATLPEHLRTAAFCRLEAVDRFANSAGDCVFASVCVDTMTDTSVETDRQTLAMQPAVVGTLCTFNPNQAQGLKGEEELHNRYGAVLMAALAKDLGRLAASGSLREPFVGQFPNSTDSQMFSVPLDSPILAPREAAVGTRPAVPKCMPVAGGCFFGVKLSQDTGWTFAKVNPTEVGGGGGLMNIRHKGSRLCLDLASGVAAPGVAGILFSCNGTASQVWNKKMVTNVHYALAAGNSGLCATVEPQAPAGTLQLSRSLSLQPCDRRPLQQFSNTDSAPTGPN